MDNDFFYRNNVISIIFLFVDRVQDFKLNQLKLKLNDTYRKNQKITTNFEPHNNGDVVNKTYLDTEKSKKEGHFSLKEKDYIEYKLRNDKHSEKVLFEGAFKTTIQTL